ncbi:MAG: STAS domain-containing protein [Anaerolineales bacterium]|nr:STAS domain-containing protein [Anaerolineales bacterium]
MEFTLHQHSHSVGIAALNGIVDVMSCHTLRQQIKQILQQGITSLVLDLQAVKMIDNSALGTLKECLQMFRDRGGELALVHVTHQVDMKIRLLRLEAVFPIYTDVNVALKRL